MLVPGIHGPQDAELIVGMACCFEFARPVDASVTVCLIHSVTLSLAKDFSC